MGLPEADSGAPLTFSAVAFSGAAAVMFAVIRSGAESGGSAEGVADDAAGAGTATSGGAAAGVTGDGAAGAGGRGATAAGRGVAGASSGLVGRGGCSLPDDVTTRLAAAGRGTGDFAGA